MKTNYRADVDGIRAVAVLSVLAYHAFPKLLSGGFIGVDVFFVISGYLISGIILAEIDSGTFTVRRFYARRIRRIFPALALVLAAVLAFGWLALAPYQFRQLGWHTTSSASFGENLLLWWKSGDYFDEGSATKPLLHLWSLGVEEQYYLLWPLLLLLLRRHLSRSAWLIAGIALVSFTLNIIATRSTPLVAFYWPHVRFWELMLGSGLALAHFRGSVLQSRRMGNCAAIAGGLLLLLGLAVISDSRPFPGWWALLPTVGTALLVAAPNAWVNRKLLSGKTLVYIGLVSYPLYLWHWPILVFGRIVANAEPTVAMRLGMLALSLLLASLTYELLERRVRRRPGAVPYLAGAVTAAGLAGILVLADIIPARCAGDPRVARITDSFDDWGWRVRTTRKGDTADAVMFIGDSHMQQYLPRLDRLVAEHRAPLRTIMLRTKGGCAPIPDIERLHEECAPFVHNTFRLAHAPQVKVVVIAASWPGLLLRHDYYRLHDPTRTPIDLKHADWIWDRLEAELSGLRRDGKHIALFLASPRGANLDPRTIAVRSGLGFEVRAPRSVRREEMLVDTFTPDEQIKRIGARVGAVIVDPMPLLCSPTSCAPVDAEGVPMYRDLSHIRATVARDRIDLLDRFVFVQSLESLP